MFSYIIQCVQDYYHTREFIPLHSPVFGGNEKKYLIETIDSTFVSSVGGFVDKFEKGISTYTGVERAVATVNGTSALHIALKLSGVQENDYVITQALTFVATCNAIKYNLAEPIFIDVDIDTMGLSPKALSDWLQGNAFVDERGICRNKKDNRIIRTCLPMHTFGHPVKLNELIDVCGKWNISIVEDAAESIGSLYHGKHTGTFGLLGILSFNGNKIMTTGGGGMILTNMLLGIRAKHLTTTAKMPHEFEFLHDEIGYNYRMPNLNAALGCAQLEQIELFVTEKRKLAEYYSVCFKDSQFVFFQEPKNCRSNYWLNSILCNDKNERDEVLKFTNVNNVMTRPIWQLMNRLPMYKSCLRDDLKVSEYLEERVVNLPSGVRLV